MPVKLRSLAPDAADFGQTADAVERLLSTVTPDQWSAPTPCAGWNLAQLTEHLIDANFSFAAELAGPPGTTHVDDAPARAVLARYRTSTRQLQLALAAAERNEDRLSAQQRDRLAVHVTDLLIHGSDIATATGQSVSALALTPVEVESLWAGSYRRSYLPRWRSARSAGCSSAG
jgi:uncharacterized protein (TIGR03086 family)